MREIYNLYVKKMELLKLWKEKNISPIVYTVIPKSVFLSEEINWSFVKIVCKENPRIKPIFGEVKGVNDEGTFVRIEINVKESEKWERKVKNY